MKNLRVRLVINLLIVTLAFPIASQATVNASEDLTPKEESTGGMKPPPLMPDFPGSQTSKEMLRKRADILETVRMKRETMIEQQQKKKETFRLRLENITDENKKSIAERIDTRLNQINTNSTDKLTNALQRLGSLLDKISTKTGELQSAGTDVAVIESEIAAAETSITSAETAITAQSVKDYTADISGEATLRNNLRIVTTRLKEDLKAVRQKVEDAKTAIKTAAMELRKTQFPESTENITESINTTETTPVSQEE